MHLYDVPVYFILAGIVLYAVLGGADFGAGFWQLTAGRGEEGDRIREEAHHAMSPVWEANHVWLIFVLTVTWTAYPTVFGSVASTLCVPLLVAAIGIIFRGAAYALRSSAADAREVRTFDTIFGISSILTPFALGTVIGGIASRRVPVGNAAGDQLTSWLNGTSILIGVLAVAVSVYTAAVYLAADSRRHGDRDLEDRFRTRSLAAGLVAGAVAIAGIPVLKDDAPALYHGLVHGDGLPALIISIVAGIATLALVWQRRFEFARYSAGVAVGAIVAGWALAQKPIMLPGLTVQQAASPHDTLVGLVVAVLAGALILFPSLALLFRLVLTGAFEREAPPEAAPRVRELAAASRTGLLARCAAAALVVGFGFLSVAEAGWAHAIGVIALFAFVVLGFAAFMSGELPATDA